MKHKFFVLAVLSLMAAGCGLAAADTQATVAAQVNATVAAMPPQEIVVTQQVVVTQVVTQEVPVEVPVTVVVEATSSEGQPTTQDTPAPEATTVVTSNTGQDPLAGANVTPIIDERFDFPNKYYWWVFGEDVSTTGEGLILDETYVLTSHVTENYEWTFDGRKLQNFYVSTLTEVDGQQCKAGDHWGLVFRYKDNFNFYMYGVSCDGKYSLMKRTPDGFETVLPPTESTAIKRLGQANVLGVRAVADQLSLYANDQFLVTVTDGTFPEGLIGMYIRTLLTPSMSVKFDDIAAYVVTQ
jgi:hypothetical protein